LLPTTFRAATFNSTGNRFPIVLLLLSAVLATSPASLRAQTAAATTAPASTASLLNAEDMAKLMPATVFFRGQAASVQARNSGGIKLPDGMFVLCALVDTSGYSTGIQQKYQGYLITEVTIDINGKTLKPGAYGVGFIEGDRFVVMDLGAHDLFTVASKRDAELKRPMPMQILADTTPSRYRLFFNRNYVVLSLAPAH
jgi:hypothetical protein